jgi:alginate O-acetyltransferase complex protein AlgI
MVFSSIAFLFYFLPIFFLSYCVSRFSKTVLLGFSLLFYFWGEPVFLPLMLISIVFTHRIGLKIEAGAKTGHSKRWLVIGVVGTLLPLITFKYTLFLVHTFLDVVSQIAISKFALTAQHVKINNIPLPLGISFYTFHSLSYLIDVYRKDTRAERGLRDLAVYISMFPQLVAGPIIRYKTIASELHQPIISTDRFATGIRTFVIGLGQKVLIANTVAASADQIFGLTATQLSTSLSWLGIVCYTLQIYFDFAGYSNMAIGLGLMIGMTFPTNFNYPYISLSMTEFWRRWHISLSMWFRDYVYIPLGGNRGSAPRTYVNLCIVFLLCGLWHGAALTFVAWGAAHGALLIIERAFLGRMLDRWPTIVRHLYVLLMVMMTWVVFRSETLGTALNYLGAMFGLGQETLAAPPIERFLKADVCIAIAVGLLAAGPLGARSVAWVGRRFVIGGVDGGELPAIALVLFLVALSLAGGAYNPFIYFRF